MDKFEAHIRVELIKKDFKDFSYFDTMYLRKRWRSPALFAAIFLAFSAVCFIFRTHAQQATLLGWVLLVVGLLVPIAYFYMFNHSINTKAFDMKLIRPQYAYTIDLTDDADGITATDKKNKSAKYKWAEIYGAFRANGCIYLYIIPTRAFILPEREIDVGGDELWAFLQKKLTDKQICKDLRKKTA